MQAAAAAVYELIILVVIKGRRSLNKGDCR